MSEPEKIVPFFEAGFRSSLKAAWLDQAAQLFDAFVDQHGTEPVCFAAVMLDAQRAKSTWDIGSPWKDFPAGSAAALGLMAANLTRAVIGLPSMYDYDDGAA